MKRSTTAITSIAITQVLIWGTARVAGFNFDRRGEDVAFWFASGLLFSVFVFAMAIAYPGYED